MKIVIGYPPLGSDKGVPLLGQNRQFQWAKTNWSAYPVVPAYAATMLKNAGHDVLWLDGINAGWTYNQWEKKLLHFKPDVLVIETKTPVVKAHWAIINHLKALGASRKHLIAILVGDHVTAMPEESLENSKVDYIITGGNYDFALAKLISLFRGEAANITREAGNFKTEKIINVNPHPNLDSLPFIDRTLTEWELYAYNNSNYGQLPGTYTMFGRDCWYGKCTFCSWANTLYPPENYQQMTVSRALDEIGEIIENYPIKEIMDDSGTFPVGEWLRKFCRGMIDRGYNQKIKINCNMRFNADLTEKDYQLMAEAGFRFLLYGLESYNQNTLDKLDKNLKIEQISDSLKMAKKAGLKPHITVMSGYPWETEEDIKQTLNFVKSLSRQKLIDSLQSTIIIPYPGTELFIQAFKNGWLKTLDWNKYDMSQPVLKTDLGDDKLKLYVRRFYSAILTPQWLLMKTKEAITNWQTFKYYMRFGRRFVSKQIDFK